MEISNIGVLFGASIGMFVIIGDIAPTTLISFCSLDWVSVSLGVHLYRGCKFIQSFIVKFDKSLMNIQ